MHYSPGKETCPDCLFLRLIFFALMTNGFLCSEYKKKSTKYFESYKAIHAAVWPEVLSK